MWGRKGTVQLMAVRRRNKITKCTMPRAPPGLEGEERHRKGTKSKWSQEHREGAAVATVLPCSWYSLSSSARGNGW